MTTLYGYVLRLYVGTVLALAMAFALRARLNDLLGLQLAHLETVLR